ncbi:MAG: hypothetical protein V4475_22775 [Pseudomonadota bacterium]
MLASQSLDEIKKDLVAALDPMEGLDKLFIITDQRTGARYCECHVRGSKFVELATPDAPLDPDEQGEYRANRDVVSNAPAFSKMKSDAKARRSFSGIVAEYAHNKATDKPLLIIGGQHRYHAIKEALDAGVDEWHGIKIYLDLTTDQRLDAQLISNTVIAISTDLFDRMHETVTGPQLRDWCQSTGLLATGEDFADRKSRGSITVQTARTFITSYYEGMKINSAEFDNKETLPPISVSGQHDEAWDEVKSAHPDLWKDTELKRAGQEYARLIAAQRKAFEGKKPKPPVDYPDKASNMALLTAWAFVAGVLRTNPVRLGRHYALADATGNDPLNVTALVKGRHKSDTDQYRGLGYRTDGKERGRFAELFALQAEDGSGITKNNINIAIMKYHAKQAQLEVEKEKAKIARANG